ncbi:MAG TPA: cation:proton antiporter [Treponemataceae bacterium]|nr:cation:proton antiporter [Treponemataceae bacterium]
MKRNTKLFLAILTFLFFATGAIFAESEASITEVMAELVLQIGIILFAVRAGGILVKKVGIPSVLGELLAGVVIGPYALGGISLPGFPHGVFPLGSGSLAVSPELYGFATVASIILLFASGLETDLGLFLKYSVAGGIVGMGGVIFSFGLGDLVGMIMLDASFMDPRCLFLGILSTATSVGITARILSDQKKMDSPEGVTILAAAVFDDVLGIIMLAVVLGIVAVMTGTGGTLTAGAIGGIAGKAFGIWLGFTAAGLIFAKRIASFLKYFKHSYDFSILALGIALILAGVFERQGLAMIIGAYIAGLSLSKTDIAAVIQERIHGLYEFFVPLFFAVMGMLVNVGAMFSVEVLVFGLIYTVVAVLAKIIGCGLPTLGLGFNVKGALRVGMGMIPRGEVALIIAGIGMTAGILNEELFGVVIMMTLLTTLVAPPMLNAVLKAPGRGTKKEVKDGDAEIIDWVFPSDEIADLVVDTLLKDLKAEGFYVQMMNIDDGLSQARKGDVSLSITEVENHVTIETAHEDAGFVRNSMFEVIVKLNEAIERLKAESDPAALKQSLMDQDARTDKSLLQLIDARCISTELKGGTKEEIIAELVDLMAKAGTVLNRDQVLADVLARERTMSTGMQNGIALPHGKSDGIAKLSVAIGIKHEGVNFDALDGQPSRLFIMVASPKKTSGPHIQFLAAISGILRNKDIVERVMKAKKAIEIEVLLSKQAN